MESDGQRLYSVLTRTDVRDKMMKEIVQISEVFSLSQSDATVALIRLGWDSFRAQDALGDDKEKFLSELGHEMIDGDNNNLVCSHKFCSDCWRDYLSESVLISCLNRDCVASVGPDTIEKLTGPVKEMYGRYVLGSFMDSNKIKRCPASGCEYVIERHEDDDDESSDFGVVCLCGHTFCWRCKLESHRPVTCNNASLWLNELLPQAREVTSMTTKPCPHCNSHVRRHRDSTWGIVTCVCSYAFCWRCLQPEEHHTGLYYCAEVFVPPPRDEEALRHHLTLWEERHKAMETSKHDLVSIERKSIPVLTQSRGLGELDMKAVREACMLIVQCRLALKWSSVFGYFMTDYHSARKQYLSHLVDEATANLLKHRETLDQLVQGAIAGGNIIGFRHKLENSTSMTGNYFHFFVKTVEDGLCEVKAGVFENVATDYWFCDRCTFQNEGFERKCRICVFPFEGRSPPPLVAASAHQQQEVPNVSSNPFASPPLLSFGINNSSASGHQQQAPNMSGNPFARDGGTNVFESAPVVAFGSSNSAHHQQQSQVANMSNNPFALPMAFGNNNSIDASGHNPNIMANNPFEGPIFSFESPPQVPNMANNPFARPEGTSYPLQSPPFVAFGSASAHQQQEAAPHMMVDNNPFPPMGFINNSHQQQVPDKPNNPPLAGFKDEASLD